MNIVMKLFRQHKWNTVEIAKLLTVRLKRHVSESEVCDFIYNYRLHQRVAEMNRRT